MTEVPDVYADQFQVNLGTFGCTINFQLSGATPVAPGAPPQVDRVATIRMSLEHLKAMVFIILTVGSGANGKMNPAINVRRKMIPTSRANVLQ